MPESKRQYYLGKVRAYASEDNVRYQKDTDGNDLLDENGNRIEKSRRPKNEALVASIDLPVGGDHFPLYGRSGPVPGRMQAIWWEIWLRPEGRGVFERAAARLEIPIASMS